MLAPWRTAGKYYHLTSQPDFKLNPEYRPENNTTVGGDWPVPGLFVSDDPATWFGGHQYHQPYVAEFDVPDEVFGHENAVTKGYLNEKFIPADVFDKIKHTRTIPYDAHVREEYGSYGPTEESSGRDFQTGQPIDVKNRKPFPDGYRYSEPEDSSWREEYQKTMNQYHRADGSEFSGGWDNYQDPRIGTYSWNPEGNKAWYHPMTGKYHPRPNVGFRGVEADPEPELHEFSKTHWDHAGEESEDKEWDY